MSVFSRLYHGQTKIDFIGKRRIWFAISLVMVVISLGALTLREAEGSCEQSFGPALRGLPCSIEFNGGAQLTAELGDDSPLADASDLDAITEVRDALRPVGAGDAQVQIAGEGADRRLLVQTEEVRDEDERAAVAEALQEVTGAENINESFISATWGGEITGKAIRALLVFLVFVTLFITIRFEFKMALASLVALLHDLTITAGVYALVGFEVTPSSVIAILTILGYSLYDTVVVFDKVEEEVGLYAATGKMTYGDATNIALNHVFMRSLNTSLATVLPVGALLFVGAGLLGAETLKDLALALLIGLIVGAYSSVFLATPLLALWKEREPKYRAIREKVQRELKVTPTPAPAGAAAATAAPSTPSTQPATTPAARTTPSRPVTPRDKRAKRRKRR